MRRATTLLLLLLLGSSSASAGERTTAYEAKYRALYQQRPWFRSLVPKKVRALGTNGAWRRSVPTDVQERIIAHQAQILEGKLDREQIGYPEYEAQLMGGRERREHVKKAVGLLVSRLDALKEGFAQGELLGVFITGSTAISPRRGTPAHPGDVDVRIVVKDPASVEKLLPHGNNFLFEDGGLRFDVSVVGPKPQPSSGLHAEDAFPWILRPHIAVGSFAMGKKEYAQAIRDAVDYVRSQPPSND